MKIVRLEEGYYYLPENNLLLNQETLNKYDKYFRNNKIELNNFNVDEYFLRKQLKDINQIIIGITEDCNLRCSYCIYNDNYLFEKKLSGRNIDLEIVKKGLLYIYGYIKDRHNKTFNISFYGGEPFIKFDLMKKIVSYSKILFNDWELIFGATTNATLLTDKIIEYLITEDFNILISLDGPQKNHNSKRVYRNGKGTFKNVWENLERIKERDAEYFYKKISFNIVHSHDQSLVDIFSFFTEEKLINMNKTYYNQVVGKNTNYHEKIHYDETKVLNDFKLIFEKIRAKLIYSNELKPIEEIFFRDYFLNKTFNSKPNSIFSGTCFFNTRLFIDVEGKFHFCEKINNSFPLGDVWFGFDFNRMVEIAKEFVNIKKKYCSYCDIKYLCRPCYIIFASNGKLELDKNFCSRYRKSVINNLKRQIRLEKNKRKINEKEKLKIYRFHQFITVEKGPINTAIANFINGDIYHVPNKIMEHFENREYKKIPEFINGAKESGLIIYVNNNTWITKQNTSIKDLKYLETIGKKNIVLCIEDGTDLSIVKNKVSHFNITQIIFYGTNSEAIVDFFPGVEILFENYEYLKCSKLSFIKRDDFIKTDEEFYSYSKVCNNCWGHKISITKDGMIRPCIYSNIIIDDLKNLTDIKTIEKIQNYWYITKDNVEKCKDCELKYFCIDCREIAQRKNNGNLSASNPNCKYNPYAGVWQDDDE